MKKTFLVFLYWAVLALLHGLRTDHFVIGIYVIVLNHSGRRAQEVLRFSLPFLLTGVIYDSQRFFSDYIRGPIHIKQPYYFDRHFFGIHEPNHVLTPNEWLQLHTGPALDFITGLAYLTFFTIFIFQSAYLFFYLSRKGIGSYSPQKIKLVSMEMIWGFFWVNVLGYTTYYWYAAAPPWYVSQYGLGPVNMNIHASPAGCERFDKLVGLQLFQHMYERATDVFGTEPSLHVAYPLLATLIAFRIGTMRCFSLLFYLLMCFAAVYLNHHYILDLIWGSAYAVIIYVLLRWYFSLGDGKATNGI